MTIELLYTSAAQGLKQGSRGFCTVVCTAGLPINLAQRLEALSGYRHLYQPGDQRADDNPVCHSHIRLAVGGKTLSILSRVGAYGVDYSQRTNKIAHHVVFDGAVPVCGPAAVLSQSGIMRTNWDGECKTLQSGPQVPSIALQPAPCQEWNRITGDAGWAGVVANAWLQPTGKPVWIVFSESQSASLLELMQEATAILPESRRWQATFSTYCTNLPPDVECRVRCVIAGSDEARMSIARGIVLDLTKPMGDAPDSDVTAAARNGYTVGTTSNLVQSIEELNNVSDQTSEESESALSTHGSDEGEYRLKRQIPGSLPIPLAMPSRRRGNEVKRRGSKSPSRQSKIWKVLAVASGVLIFFSLVGSGVFYFATTKNPIAGIVEDTPKEKPEPVLEKTKDNTERNTVPDGDPPADAIALSDGTQGSIETKPPHEIQLSLDQTRPEINENNRIEKELVIATVIVSNANLADVTLSTGHEYFDYHDGKVYLKAEKDGYNYELTPELKGELKIGDTITAFSVSVTNVDDRNLVVVISDESGKQSATTVFEGAKLKADVEAESKDDDEAKDSKRTFTWMGRQGDGEWKKFGTNQEVLLNSEFTEVYCELSYTTSVPSPETKLESEKIRIQPLGKATIKFSSIFFALNLDMQIEVSFPELSVESPKIRYSFRWMEHDKYLDGNKLKIDLMSNGANQFNPPSKYFRSVSASDEVVANGWLLKATSQSKAVREHVSNLKNSMWFIKSNFARSQVATALMQFVHGISESPNEEFFQSIESVDQWIKEAVALKTLAMSIRDDEGKRERKAKEKLAELNRLETGFAKAFSVISKSTFATDTAENEIVGFSKLWDLDNDPKNTSPNKVENIVRRNLTVLVSSIRELRNTMASSLEFEIILESKANMLIWKSEPKKGTSGDWSIKKKDADSIYNQPFRVRTRVLFQDVKPEMRETRGVGSRENPGDDPSSLKISPKPAKQMIPVKIPIAFDP